MDLPAKEVLSKKKVGLLKGSTVWAIAAIGGLHIIADSSGEVLGMASHPALARHAARRLWPSIEYTELAKSEALDPEVFAAEIQKWVDLTVAWNKRTK